MYKRQVRSFVDPCPIELGRDAALMREIAEKSEMNVICTTGFYFEEIDVYKRQGRAVRRPLVLAPRRMPTGFRHLVWTGVEAGP